MGNHFHIVEQSTLGMSEAGFIQLTLDNRVYALVVGSLNTQEVCMTINSIRAAVQIGDIAGDHLFMAA